MQVSVWAQMFNKEGDVTQGVRIAAALMEEPKLLNVVAKQLLNSVNWDEGYLLVWGAGGLVFCKASASLSKELEILASETSMPWSLQHKNPELNALDQE